MKKYSKQYSLTLDLQTFADPPADPPADPLADPSKDKTFTQAELDQHVQQRVARAEKAAQKQLAKDLGFESVEAMQTALKKTEPKKKDGDKDAPVDVDSLIEEKLQEEREKTFRRLLNAEVKVWANELGFADWEDALKLADLSKVKENDKGDLEGVKEALEDLLKRKPHLGKQKAGSGAFGANIGGSGSPENKKKSQEDIIKLAKSRGTANGQAAYDPWAKK